MLTTSRRHYQQQQRVSALAVREARRRSSVTQVASAVVAYQLAAAMLSFECGELELSEQGLNAPPAAAAEPRALVSQGALVASMLEATSGRPAVDRLVSTLVNDAGRTASLVDIVRRPAISGYVRSLNLPSCSRCAVLAGRVYRYSTGFQRHPLCDCIMTPTTAGVGDELTLDPTDAIEKGQITGLSKGDLEALDLGADLGQVVNVRRRAAGLRVGTSVIERGNRLTPQGIARLASTRDEAIRLLRANRYLM